MKKLIFLLLFNIVALVAQANDELIEPLKRVLFSKDKPSLLSLEGRIEYFSAYEQPKFEPVILSDFNGVIDLRTGRLNFDFIGFKRAVSNWKQPYKTSDYNVVFDSKKWLLTERAYDSDPPLPKNLKYLSTISETIPRPFTDDLSQFCFPLFAELTFAQADGKSIPLLQVLANPQKYNASIEAKIKDGDLELIVKSQCVSDRYIFDVSKGYALKQRDVDFNGCIGKDGVPIVNRLIIKEFYSVAGVSIPKLAEFKQTLGDKEITKRIYKISKSSFLKEYKKFTPVIPAEAMVEDKRFGLRFSTSKETVSE